MRAIRVSELGGPEVLRLEEVPDPTPSQGQALIRLEAVGVNMIDARMRAGAHPGPLPYTPGTEAAGVVVAVGPGVSDLEVGDRVGFAGVAGAYAELIAADATRLVRLPDGVSTEIAAAVLLQGMTAHYLVHSVCPLEAGDVVVVHAAAGGTGLLITQLAVRRGLRVIGTTSTREKA
ncbi:MAG TPA: alcohol dehydrogenase catalytic domain-containing protein, partial [Candidatus Limnocylindrales bacterium]